MSTPTLTTVGVGVSMLPHRATGMNALPNGRASAPLINLEYPGFGPDQNVNRNAN